MEVNREIQAFVARCAPELDVYYVRVLDDATRDFLVRGVSLVSFPQLKLEFHKLKSDPHVLLCATCFRMELVRDTIKDLAERNKSEIVVYRYVC